MSAGRSRQKFTKNQTSPWTCEVRITQEQLSSLHLVSEDSEYIFRSAQLTNSIKRVNVDITSVIGLAKKNPGKGVGCG